MATKLFEFAKEDHEEGFIDNPHDDYVRLELAEEPIAVGEDPEIHEAEELDQTSIELGASAVSDSDTITSLESIASYIQKANTGTPMDRHAVAFANMAIESIYSQAGLNDTKLTFSMEGYASDPAKEIKAALEGIQDRVSELFAALKDSIVKLSKHIGDVLKGFNRNILKLKKRTQDVEKQLKEVTLDTPKFGAIKPESWCEYLCYTESGFSKGLKGISGDVEWLLDEHAKMATSSIAKYIDWFKQHSGDTSNDFLFRKLWVNKDDFLLPGMTEFNRSIGLHTPGANNMFYRSKELPGGRAFFTSVETTNKNGLAAITMLGNVRFDMSYYDPMSYKVLQAQLGLLSSVSMRAWAVGVMSVNPALGIGLTVGALALDIANQKTSHVSGTGHQVKIDKKHLFETLTLDEAKRVLSEVKFGATKLEKWNSDVLQKPWKNKDIDAAINKIISFNKNEVHNGVGVRWMRTYCYALLNLMNKHTVKVHTYSFRAYNAMLNFTEKSLKQYH